MRVLSLDIQPLLMATRSWTMVQDITCQPPILMGSALAMLNITATRTTPAICVKHALFTKYYDVGNSIQWQVASHKSRLVCEAGDSLKPGAQAPGSESKKAIE